MEAVPDATYVEKKTEFTTFNWEYLINLKGSQETLFTHIEIFNFYDSRVRISWKHGNKHIVQIWIAFLISIYHFILIGTVEKGWLLIFFIQKRNWELEMLNSLYISPSKWQWSWEKQDWPSSLMHSSNFLPEMYCSPSHLTYNFHTSRRRYPQIYLFILAWIQRNKAANLVLSLCINFNFSFPHVHCKNIR